MRGLQPVTLETLQDYNVNVEGQPDVVWQPLWDYQTYPNAGFSGETLFFQEPIGTNSKTIVDTNMRSQGRVPTPVNMLITGIEFVFFPGVDPVALSGDVAVDSSIWNDVYAVFQGGMSFKLEIGDKVWLEESPLGVFPTQFKLQGAAALHYSESTASDELAKIDYASICGPMYQVMPYRLISNQEFQVSVRSPSSIALPSGEDAKWGFRLHGYRFRLAQ